jgi:hypothetical protein
MKPQTKKSMLRTGKRVILSLLLILAISFRGTIKDIIAPEKPTSKTIEISMFSSSDYSQEVYKNSKAKVEVTISKYRNKKFEVVYSTTLEAGDLMNIPTENNAFVKYVQVDNFYENKELLVATYTVSYESNGSILKYNKHILIPESKGKRELNLNI